MSSLSSLGAPGFDGPGYLLPLETSSSLDQCSRPLLPAFSSRQYNQLPTPQSPNNFAPYIGPRLQPSPLHHGAFTSVLSSSDSEHSKTISENKASGSLMMTPDSSPFSARWETRCPTGSPPRMHSPNFRPASSPEPSTSAVKLESPMSDQATPLAPAPSISPPSSHLSSPFAPRTPVPGRKLSLRRSASPLVNAVTEMKMNGSPRNQVSSRSNDIDLPLSSPLEPAAEIVSTYAGGEMERLRQVMLENQLAQMREAENRRPDYLKRDKRAGNDTDFGALDKSNQSENDRGRMIGIIDSPNKGRRLTLFQETSEESFEESLMAGGYGRYRTTEWVRQPQPLALTNASVTGPSNVVALLEQAQEPLVLEKELRKRKRLEAFRGPGVPRSNLLPVELEGRGRVLIDSARDTSTYNNDTTSKRRGGGRRKKKGSKVAVQEEQNSIPSTVKRGTQKPNWLDHEFPWRLRTEEIAGAKKVENEVRLKLIEEFLDRDSDDEDQEEITVNGESHLEETQKALARGTGGKMVLLPTKSELKWGGLKSGYSSERKMFPCDPADARTALLAKRSVRSLSYRLQRRQVDDNEEEIVCICNGANDGRQLVQCDGCETWYHLQCIGIKSIDELGREEDPWFCQSCRGRSSSAEPRELLSSEPTFVPTDEELRTYRMQDAPFFQPSPSHNSPSWSFERVPKTPTHRNSYLEPPELSSGSWVNSSGHGPSTPHHTSHGIRVYSHDSSAYNRSFEESPFDPTSTPSRGIKFGLPFLTPRNAVWSTRPPGLVQTPSKPSERDISSTRGGLTVLSSGFDGSQRSGGYGFGRFPSFDESPIRRSRSGEEPPLRRYPESPLASRSHPPILLEESPIVRSKGKEKL
ncbi:hypothetical protein AX14_008578 [Amanita brunnescens Koide BX004]|nr:hypothetical protein AX14_008578 [Amanita brunnescens Koide BX004]